MKSIFLSAVLVLLVFLICAVSCTAETGNIKEKVKEAFDEDTLEITEIILCESVAQDFTPIGPTEIFEEGTKEIFLSVRFDNLAPENVLKAEWYYYGNSETISIQEFQTDKVLSGYNSFNIKVKEGFPSGDYKVSVFLDEETLKVIEFTVK
jgi:hypothetical protein